MFRPDNPFMKDEDGDPKIHKDGKYRLDPLYKSYVRGIVGMDSDERREWASLGCKLSLKREARLVDLTGTYVFLETPVGENGDA